MTEQIEYVQKRLELLDPQRLHLVQVRTKRLNQELLAISSEPKEIKELGHTSSEVRLLCKEFRSTIYTLIVSR